MVLQVQNSNELPNIRVNLYMDDVLVSRVVLSEVNDWSYEWPKMPAGHAWRVEEAEVPENFEVSYAQDESGFNFTITNTRKEDPSTVITELNISKVWTNVPAGTVLPNIQVGIYCEGQLFNVVTLSATNNWSFKWDNIPAAYADKEWSVKEMKVPTGWEVSYAGEGQNFVITNNGSKVPTTVVVLGIGVNQTALFLGMAAVLLASAACIVLFLRKRREEE